MSSESKEFSVAMLKKYAVTKHGDNPYTPEAAVNVLFNCLRYEDVLKDCGGTLSSAYRCGRVNEIVGGAKGSLHLLGLAMDVLPPDNMRLVDMFYTLTRKSEGGAYGSVNSLILEPTWVHISWMGGPVKEIKLCKKIGDKYVRVDRKGDPT